MRKYGRVACHGCGTVFSEKHIETDDRPSCGPDKPFPEAVPFCNACMVWSHGGHDYYNGKPIYLAVGNSIYNEWERKCLKEEG